MHIGVLSGIQNGRLVLSMAVNRNSEAIDDPEILKEALMLLYGSLSVDFERGNVEKIFREVVDYYEED